MKKLFCIILMFLIMSCNDIEFIYADKNNLINPLYNKTKIKMGVNKSLKSSTKISTKNQNIKLLEKQEKVEKRQGWWNH